MTEKLTYDPTPADAPELSEEEQNSLEVAEKLGEEEAKQYAGKFENAEELEKAYIELQKKLGSDDDEKPETTTETEDTEKVEGYLEDGSVDYDDVNNVYGETIGKLFKDNSVDPWEISKHFHENNGKITDKMYSTLENTGLSRAAIDAYLAGRALESGYTSTESEQTDLSDAQVDAIHNSVGGEAEYNKMIAWGQSNLDQSQLAAFNQIVKNADVDQIQMAVSGMQAKYRDAEGYEGKMLTGKAAAASSDVFRSQAEVVQALGDPRYDRDPAYRQDIYDKLERSNIKF